MNTLKKTSLIILLVFSHLVYAQVLPDINYEIPSASHCYYENQGQIIDDSGYVRNEILFYTERMQPAVYLSQDKASFVVSRIDTNSNDSIKIFDTYRIDMEFICNPTLNNKTNSNNTPCATIVSTEQGVDHLNYYLPHCGTDGITDVPGFKRIIYQNVFPEIDYHFYSNSLGLKSYIVIKPGGNPNNILLQFSGQDSLGIIDSNLLLYLNAGFTFSLPQATAYQIDSSGNPLILNWNPDWINQGNGLTTLQTYSYNTNLPLVIRIASISQNGYHKTNGSIPGLDWSTYYGGNASDNVRGIKLDNNTNLFSISSTSSSNFPTTLGAKIQPTLSGTEDAYITKFNSNSERSWATYYGGLGNETPNKIAVTTGFDDVYIIGTVITAPNPSPNSLPLLNISGAYTQTTFGGGYSDAFISSFNKNNGYLTWSTYFGGSGQDEGNSIVLSSDDNGKLIFITGVTNGTSFSTNCPSTPSVGEFPVCASTGNNAYNQNFNNGGFDGFVAEFGYVDVNHPKNALLWSTLFGGEGDDVARDIAFMLSPFNLVICGETNSNRFPNSITSPCLATSGIFPLASNGTPNNYIQNTPGSTDGFIAKFSNTLSLVWSTLFGGNEQDGMTSICFTNNRINAVGYTSTGYSMLNPSQVSCMALSNGKIPICNNNNSSYIQNDYGGGATDLLITQFNLNGDLKWSTYYGGNANEYSAISSIANGPIIVANYSGVFIAGGSGGLKSFSGNELDTDNPNNLFFQPTNADRYNSTYYYDGFILAFGANNERDWATFFGGGIGNSSGIFSDEIINGIDFANGSLFVGGYTNNSYNTLPLECPRIISPPTQPFCTPTLSGSNDGFLARFDIGQFKIGINNESSKKNNFTLYPTCTETKIKIYLPFEATGTAEIIIYDNQGRLILRKFVSGQTGIESFEIDVSSLSAGLYFITATNQNTYASKFIKK